MQPDFITQEMVNKSIDDLYHKEKALPSLDKVRFEKYHEGLSAQVLYLGPYSDEGPTIKKLHDFIEKEGGIYDGFQQKHHEIYLSNPQRTKPDRLKTIIRQPYVK
jgi:hypothetical protein